MWLLRDELNELEISARVDSSLVRISLRTGHDESHLSTRSPLTASTLLFPLTPYPVGPPVMDKWRLVGGLERKSVSLYCQRDGGP